MTQLHARKQVKQELEIRKQMPSGLGKPEVMAQQTQFGGANAAYNRSKNQTYQSNKGTLPTDGNIMTVEGLNKHVH